MSIPKIGKKKIEECTSDEIKQLAVLGWAVMLVAIATAVRIKAVDEKGIIT